MAQLIRTEQHASNTTEYILSDPPLPEYRSSAGSHVVGNAKGRYQNVMSRSQVMGRSHRYQPLEEYRYRKVSSQQVSHRMACRLRTVFQSLEWYHGNTNEQCTSSASSSKEQHQHHHQQNNSISSEYQYRRTIPNQYHSILNKYWIYYWMVPTIKQNKCSQYTSGIEWIVPA